MRGHNGEVMGRWKVAKRLRFGSEKFTLDFHLWFSYDTAA